jgi:hypothetical protein
MKRLLAAIVTLVVAAAGILAWPRLSAPKLPPPPSPQRLAALRAERDVLQRRLRDIVIAQGEKSLADAPKAGIMIGIPTGFTASILEQVVTGLFGETTLNLKDVRVHHEGEVKAKLLIAKRRVGTYVLDVKIHRVQGILKPGKPALAFGRNQVHVVLPVRLAGGQGDAEIRFQWDSKGIAASAVCGDVDVTRPVSGGVVPEDYSVRGSFAIAATGTAIELRPRFPDLAVRIFVDPSEQAWGVVDGVVKDQRKGCEIVLTKADLKEKLGAMLGRGFNVKVPQKIFKPVRLPAGIRQSLELQGVELSLHVKPTGILVAQDRLWYGADVSLASRRVVKR